MAPGASPSHLQKDHESQIAKLRAEGGGVSFSGQRCAARLPSLLHRSSPASAQLTPPLTVLHPVRQGAPPATNGTAGASDDKRVAFYRQQLLLAINNELSDDVRAALEALADQDE